MHEPQNESELLSRVRALAGHTLGELAAAQGGVCPQDLRRAKGFVGELIERALGVPRGTGASAPDFPALGIELKTLPIGRDGMPRESTFVCSASLANLAALDWSESPVHAKLARVLWVPVEAEPSIALATRRVGHAWLWTPTPEQEQLLRADWREIAERVAVGDAEHITAHLGRCMQLRPKAASARVLGSARDADGALVRLPPRGFYLRRSFTALLLASAHTDVGAERA